MLKSKIAALLIPAMLGVSYVADHNAAFATANSNGLVVKTVNFREKPSLSGDQIRYLSSGEQLKILDEVNSYWYKVEDRNGTIGYVSSQSQYVQVVNSETGVVTSSVNFRDKPSLSGKRIRYLTSGERVELIEKVNSYWYKVKDANRTNGYVSTQPKYIKFGALSPTPGKPETAPANIEEIIQSGMKYLGTPYEFGSDRSTVSTFDCSDFVRQAFKEGSGITLPADSRKQADHVKKIGKTTTNWRDLKPGDLMFFMSYKGSKESSYSGINKAKQRITHDGIYLGNGKILHTYSKKSGGVRVDTIEGKHWEYRFVFGGSAIK
ncbi:SH3 domain-containing protein [Marinicrinis lubricantis]|uniref:SH3 domain-containing protein n=1 Tax=Marinicrinis lubricantis TaxID=2086470 RepID=A0ABW1INI1_9BACL